MIKTEICRKLNDGRTLVYYLIECADGPSPFGAEIEHIESGTVKTIHRLSNDRERVLRLIDRFATEFITPNTMDSVAFKWLTEI